MTKIVRVWGLGLLGLCFRMWIEGLKDVRGKVQGSGLGFRNQGLGFRV